MRIEIARLHQELGATMIYVTHDQVEAMTLADRIVVFNKGAIEQVGTPHELYEHPQNLFVANFIGSPKMNILGATAVADADGSWWATLSASCRMRLPDADGIAAGTTLSGIFVGIRPEHLVLVPRGPGTISGVTIATEYLGNDVYAYIALDGIQGEPVVVRLQPEAAVAAGCRVHAYFPPDRIHVFGPDGKAVPR
jgi:multiple sugar transport system ATP-binding protein